MAFFLGAIAADAIGLEIGATLAGAAAETLAWLPVVAKPSFVKKAYKDLKDHPVDTLLDAGQVAGVSMFRGAFDPVGSAIDTVKGEDAYVEHNRNYTVGEAGFAVAMDAAFGGLGWSTASKNVKALAGAGKAAEEVAEKATEGVAQQVAKATSQGVAGQVATGVAVEGLAEGVPVQGLVDGVAVTGAAAEGDIAEGVAEGTIVDGVAEGAVVDGVEVDPGSFATAEADAAVAEENGASEMTGPDPEEVPPMDPEILQQPGSDGFIVSDEHAHYRQASEDTYLDLEERGDIGAFEIDPELSTKRTTVYHNHETGQTMLAHRGSVGIVKDWLTSDPAIAMGRQHKDPRFILAMAQIERAQAKHGYDVVTTGHSLGGTLTMHSAYEFAHQPWMKEAVAFNPGNSVFQSRVFTDSERVASADALTTVRDVFGDPVSATPPAFGKRITHVVPTQNPLKKHVMSSFTKPGVQTTYARESVRAGGQFVFAQGGGQSVARVPTPTVASLFGLSQVSEDGNGDQLTESTEGHVTALPVTNNPNVHAYGMRPRPGSDPQEIYLNFTRAAMTRSGVTPYSYKNSLHQARDSTQELMRNHPGARIHLGGKGIGGLMAAQVLQDMGHHNQIASAHAFHPGRATMNSIAAKTHHDRSGVMGKMITLSSEAHVHHSAAAAQGTHLIQGPGGIRQLHKTPRQTLHHRVHGDLLQQALDDHNRQNPVSDRPIGIYTEPEEPEEPHYEHEPPPEIKEDVLEAVISAIARSEIVQLPAGDMYEIIS